MTRQTIKRYLALPALHRLATAALALALACLAGLSAARQNDAVTVSVTRNGDAVHITAEFRVPVPAREAWAVMTDFEHMPAFLPNLKESHVLSQAGDHLTVLQKGESRIGPLALGYESLRDVELKPYELIRSKNLKSDSLRSMEGVTYLAPEGRDATHVYYSAIAVPNSALAALVPTDLLREELKAQFLHLRDEMLRRDTIQLGKVRQPPTKG